MNTERMVELRKNAHLLQKDIADVLKVTRRAYSFWETGDQIIPLKQLNTLCNYFNVSLDYILCLNKNNDLDNIINIEVLDRKDIGKRLKQVRNDNNLSLRALAHELNTTASTLSAYERGLTLILTAFAYEICKNYNVSMDWLVGRKK